MPKDDIKERLIGRVLPYDNDDIGVTTVRLPNREDVWETALTINNKMYVVGSYKFLEDAKEGHEYWVKHSKIDQQFISKYPECTIDRNGNRVKSNFNKFRR